MKKWVLLGLVLLGLVLLILPFCYAQPCNFDPRCLPDVQDCGCGGTQSRYTLCYGGCSDWNTCSVSNVETQCTDSNDNDCDGAIDCADTDCAGEANCIDEDNDGFSVVIDCKDNNPDINPAAQEICNLRDDNCDGRIDEDLVRSCGQSQVGLCTLGEERCLQGTWQECNAVLPTTEACDGLDNDCDGTIDNGCACTDGETKQCGTTDQGICQFGTQTCMLGNWGTCQGSIEPTTEVCGDNLDNNCNGEIDEECQFPSPTEEELEPQPAQPTPAQPTSAQPAEEIGEPIVPTRPCIDMDNDGYGINCKAGPDCDDTNANINYGAKEECDGIDNNCNGRIDELLTRTCGTNKGICKEGTEQCRDGIWGGCTAVQPKTNDECRNYLDDDCDGTIDEGCEETVVKEEVLLRNFFGKEYGDSQDFNEALKAYRETKDQFIVKKTSQIKQGKTELRISIEVKQPMKDIIIYESIPKTLAQSTDNIKFSTEPKIIQKDPLVAWHFAELQSTTELTYEVEGEHADAHLETDTIAFSHKTGKEEIPWYILFLPVVIIPLAGLMFITLVQLSKKHK